VTEKYDLAVVGAGVLGLAHACLAARAGKRVIVVEKDAKAVGASIRNFGFISVTGQADGDCWRLARRSRDIWDGVVSEAGIPVLQRGVVMTARREEAEAVIDAFLATEMGADCRRMTPREAQEMVPSLRTGDMRAALYSPHEIRVESKDAIPALARWLAAKAGVTFRWSTTVTGAGAGRLETTSGPIAAEAIVACPGDTAPVLYADRWSAHGLSRSKLQMMRVRPEHSVALETAVMSDLGLARYSGCADLPAAGPLKARLDREQAAHRANGVHLIVVQSADGSLVVGDSHHYADTPDPFINGEVNDLILDELRAVMDLGDFAVTENWVGTYAWAPDKWLVREAPDAATRLVIVSAGCGASTAFGIAEETVRDLWG
jgi:FAD dependent oxidoreductase TIGR03364